MICPKHNITINKEYNECLKCRNNRKAREKRKNGGMTDEEIRINKKLSDYFDAGKKSGMTIEQVHKSIRSNNTLDIDKLNKAEETMERINNFRNLLKEIQQCSLHKVDLIDGYCPICGAKKCSKCKEMVYDNKCGCK